MLNNDDFLDFIPHPEDLFTKALMTGLRAGFRHAGVNTWGSMIFYEVFGDMLVPEDQGKVFECPICGREIGGEDKIEMVDKKEKIFKCPGCNKPLKFDSGTNEFKEA